jgi:hypothetical protein
LVRLRGAQSRNRDILYEDEPIAQPSQRDERAANIHGARR